MALSDFKTDGRFGGFAGGGLSKYTVGNRTSATGNYDLSTSEGLLSLARDQGGAVAGVAEELVHPEKSMLSWASDNFKRLFGTFIDTISIPSEVVAGIISPDLSIGEAISTKARPSSVLFGEPNPEDSTLQKVGNFFVRTGTDILLDPITYVTFGAGQGIFGISAAVKVPVTTAAGERVLKSLNPRGKELYLRGVEMQRRGLVSTAMKTEEIAKINKIPFDSPSQKYIQMYSSNIEEVDKFGKAITYDEAVRRLSSVRQADIKSLALDINKANGLTARELKNVIGDTKDYGVENAFFEIGKGADEATIRYATALKGLAGNQKSVLQFIKDRAGKDNLYIIEHSLEDAAVRETIIKAGIEFRTLDKGRFMIYDEGKVLSKTVTDLSTKINGKLTTTPGRGEFIGGNTRAEGLRKYRQIIADYEGRGARIHPDTRIPAGEIANSLREGSPTLKTLIKNTLDANLDREFVKESIGKLIARDPKFAQLYLDKGGIKFFGTSILAGQRISSAMRLIPQSSILDDLLSPIKNTVHALFSTAGDVQFGKLPEEFSRIEQRAKDLVEANKMADFKKWQDVAAAFKLNIGETNILFDALEANKIPADARLADAWMKIKSLNKFELRRLRASGFAVMEEPNHVPHVLVSQPARTLPFTTPPSRTTGALLERKLDDTLANLEAQGVDVSRFDRNVVSAELKRSLENSRAIVMSDFIKELGEKFGVSASKAPQGYRTASITGLQNERLDFSKWLLAKNGEEIAFHPAIAKRIENFVGSVINDEPTNKALEAFDKMQGIWKASVTSIFPAFHGRNAISNVLLHFMDIGLHSLNPANHVMSGQLIRNDRLAEKLQRDMLVAGAAGEKAKADFYDLMTQTVLTDRTGYTWSFGELRRVIKENQVAFSPNVTGAVDIRTQRGLEVNLFQEEGKGAKIVRRVMPTSQEFAPFAAGRSFGRAVEEQARLLDFLVNLKDTGDVVHAATRTKMFLFDYTNLTGFERAFARRMIPFYTFTRKNLETQVRTLLTTPGRTAMEVTALTTIGDVLSGTQLSEEQKKALPTWVKSGIFILSKKRGETIEVLQSLGTPIEQPFQQFQPNQFLGSVSPLLRVPLEQASGYSFFQGKALSDVTNASAFIKAPTFVKDFIGFSEIQGRRSDGRPFTWYVSLRPERMNLLLNMPPTSRVLSSLKQMEATDVSGQSKILQQLIGIRPFTFDLEQEAQKRERELRTKIEAALNTARVTASFKRTFIPKEN